MPALPPMLYLLIVCLLGMGLGAIVNWATYSFAWFNPRQISPWGPKPQTAPARRWSDRLPVIGWWGLRREHAIHGRGFWIRPMLVELAMGCGLAMLYWWEVQEQGLVTGQIGIWVGIPLNWTQASFLNHALLITLMAAASLIDIDEKTIPDEITVPGTLLGLTLAALLPMGLLPHIEERPASQVVSAPVNLPPPAAALLAPGSAMYIEPVTLATPNGWPAAATGWQALLLGQACWWLWCFALTPRIYRGRRGMRRAVSLIMRRVVRELTRPPLGVIAWPGSIAIAAVWWWGEAAWLGMLTSLVGLAVSGGLVWAVRKAGTAALKREAMGFGDVTLMMMVGTFLGWQSGIIIFFVAPFAGLIVGIIQLITRSDDVIPYGPFLCLGSLFVMVRWADVWNQTQFAFRLGWLVPAIMAVCIVLLGVMLFVWQQIKIRLFKL